ncbi:hypothetical protein F5B17DRAFT_32474 [Nemania serpens]|nr:hypothetical protein F5B17DRAFT_32474 [Nemania serpens]
MYSLSSLPKGATLYLLAVATLFPVSSNDTTRRDIDRLLLFLRCRRRDEATVFSGSGSGSASITALISMLVSVVLDYHFTRLDLTTGHDMTQYDVRRCVNLDIQSVIIVRDTGRCLPTR